MSFLVPTACSLQVCEWAQKNVCLTFESLVHISTVSLELCLILSYFACTLSPFTLPLGQLWTNLFPQPS